MLDQWGTLQADVGRLAPSQWIEKLGKCKLCQVYKERNANITVKCKSKPYRIRKGFVPSTTLHRVHFLTGVIGL